MSWISYAERPINLKDAREVQQIQEFLAGFALSFDGNVDYTVGLYQEERLVATGSRRGEVLRNIAVDDSLQGEGLTAQLIGHLVNQAIEQGIMHQFIFTKPRNAVMFEGLGFRLIASAVPYAALLEMGSGSIAEYCANVSEQSAHLPDGPRAGIVVNCNPFTLGHRALIEYAAAQMPTIVFVVQDDLSYFPFKVRLELVRKGLADLPNVAVVPGGKYIISSATFPAYFTKESEVAQAQTALDATIFATRIAPALNIVKRYLGQEPLSPVTEIYNQALSKILPRYKIDVEIIKRIQAQAEPISASRVRQLLSEDNLPAVRQLVPGTTYDFLISEQALPIINRIKAGLSI